MASIAVAFDFEKRKEWELPLEEAVSACKQGLSYWIDLDLDDGEIVERTLREIGINPTAIDETLTHPVAGRCDVYDECLHAAVAATGIRDGCIVYSHADLMIGERFLVTLHRGPVEFVEMARKNYRQFFYKFAKTMGFLLFELWDHVIEGYRKSLHAIEDDVERVQSRIFGVVDDEIFGRVAELTQTLLLLRRNVLANREVLHQLSMRQSSFVAESARPHLSNMVGRLDRLGSDLTVEREILAETLNLYLGIVSHRTNRVVNRLTAISAIFMPLTFLCGVYGMNFEHLPEFKWELGYLYFWGLAGTIAVSLLTLMRVKRWI